MKVKKGVIARDLITGFTGTVVGHSDYITGCDQWLIQPECGISKNDTKPDALWFDDGRVEYLSESPIMMQSLESDTGPGADIAAPIK